MPVRSVQIVTCGRCGDEWQIEEGTSTRNLAVLSYPRGATANEATALLMVEDVCDGCSDVFSRLVEEYRSRYPGGKRARGKREKDDTGQLPLAPPAAD
jgi:hypothetical protein